MAVLQNRPHVPQFGNWEADNDTPFTAVFDNARKGRTDGRMINPNDPQENPDMFANHGLVTESEERVGTGRGAAHERGYSKEDGKVDNLGRRASDESPQQQNSGRTAKPSARAVHSIDRSPRHPQHQPKLAGRGSKSPALEGKISYDSSHGGPGRSRGRPASRRNDETPNRVAVLPKFGEWDATNPASADNYTEVFNNARLDCGACGASFPPGKDPHLKSGSVKVSCFLWWWWK